jgi:hypothetical protein
LSARTATVPPRQALTTRRRLHFACDFVEQIARARLDDVDLSLQHLHVREVELLVFFELHGVAECAQIRDQRADEFHVVGHDGAVEAQSVVEAEGLLPPRTFQQSFHAAVASGSGVELALKLEFEEVHVLHVLVLEAVRVHDDIQQIQDIVGRQLRVLPQSVDRAVHMKKKTRQFSRSKKIVYNMKNNLQDRVRHKHDGKRDEGADDPHKEIHLQVAQDVGRAENRIIGRLEPRSTDWVRRVDNRENWKTRRVVSARQSTPMAETSLSY